MFPEHPIHFLISVYSFIISPIRLCCIPIFDVSLRCWQRIWLILPHCTGFHHLPINEVNSTRRGSNVSIFCVNSNCDTGSLVDCLIARLIIRGGNSSTGLDWGLWGCRKDNAFWHAKSDPMTAQHLYQKYLTDIICAHVMKHGPCNIPSFGKFPKHTVNKSQGFKYPNLGDRNTLLSIFSSQ